MKKYTTFKLQYLIMGVAFLAVFLTSLVSIWSGYRMNEKTLTENTLETNRVYAEKLASSANDYLEETFKLLNVNATEMSAYMDDGERLERKADLLRRGSTAFNSIIVMNAKGKIIATSPQSLNLKGIKVTSRASKKALEERKPMISEPYKTTTSGREIIFISTPIYDANNRFLGVLGGTIYLKENNVLNQLLGKHPYENGSYVYVVDANGQIIYHEDKTRIGDNVPKNNIVQKVLMTDSETGAERVVNKKNTDMLVGYAKMEISGWGVIAQRPTALALAPAGEMVNHMMLVGLPLLLLALVIVIMLARKIAKPLQELADITVVDRDEADAAQKNFQSVTAWYYEAIQLKQSLMSSFSHLHNQVHFFRDQSATDALTGLTNRRTIDELMNSWHIEQRMYSLILIDIDKFKSINDTYGHGVGDEVLQFLARKMENVARSEDVCCRYGGEEFVILLPNTPSDIAMTMAELLRQNVESTAAPHAIQVTLSAGVATFPVDAHHPKQLLEKADDALYYAKEHGRNQVILAK